MIAAKVAAERPQRRVGGPPIAQQASDSSPIGLTPLRGAVLDAVQAAGVPVGAYELIPQLQARLGRRVAPPTVYRSLNYLCRTGLVTRLESLNAYMARSDPASPRGDAIFICGKCGVAKEVGTPRLSGLLDRSAVGLGFRIERRVIELEGTCARCLAVTTAAPTAPCTETVP
jgi:Fur family zinc uptake transcriptional regulator